MTMDFSALLNPDPVANSSLVPDDFANSDAGLASEGFAPELFEDAQPTEARTIKNEDEQNSVDATMLDQEASPERSMKAPTSKARRSAEDAKKDTRHSSKNEGQHTDRRYLCYICQKLFTRRRSVRDHLSKIHNTKTWEPSRSLEIIVEPETGEPLEPLEEQVARGGAAPLEAKSHRREREQDSKSHEPEPEHEHETQLDEPVLKTEVSTEPQVASIEPVVPAPVIGKKRSLAATKKGMAKIKTSTSNKRPKLGDSPLHTPFRSPSVASAQRFPASKLSRATQSPASSRDPSVEPSASPASSDATPGSTNDDGEIFCICRKGDNHTWMIACDGGCEEWFHGNCVNIRERDGDLIDKYICPNCRREGYQTTWKRMCRRKGCRKPAKVFEDPPSKYCSRDCGRMFFVELIKKGDDVAYVTKNGQHVVEMEKPHKKKKKRRQEEKKKKIHGDLTPMFEGSRPHTPAYSEDERTDYETDSSMDDDMLPNRGGALRAGEVKALLEKCSTIDEWRELGRKPATPPREPDTMDAEVKMEFDEFENVKLASIAKEKSHLKHREQILAARETFLDLIKTRSAGITDEVKKSNPKQKDLCGFDVRVAWSETEFVQWWQSGGKEVLESGKMTPPEHLDKDEVMTNGVDNVDEEEEEDGSQKLPTKGGVCIKNRCQRHGSNRWQKAQLAELRFEQDLVRREIEKFELQEREIRDRVIVRSWENRS